jgi:hypothetical protein
MKLLTAAAVLTTGTDETSDWPAGSPPFGDFSAKRLVIEREFSDAGVQIKMKHSPFMVTMGTEVTPTIEVENKGEMKSFNAEEISPAGLEDKDEGWKLVVYPKKGQKKTTVELLRTPPAWKKPDEANVATKKGERAPSKAVTKEVEVVNKPFKVARASKLKALVNKDIDCIVNEPMKSDNIERKLGEAGVQIKMTHSPFMVTMGTEVTPMIEVEKKGEMKPFNAKENSPAGLEDKEEDWKCVEESFVSAESMS